MRLVMRKRLIILISLILILLLMLAGCGGKPQAAAASGSEKKSDEKDYKIESIRGEIYGVEEPVTLADGSQTTAIVFDNAATTPAFKDVNNEVVEKLAMYGYAGSGKGQKSAAVAAVYEETRKTVLDFVNADPDLYTAFFCSNTTDGINKLSSALVTDEGDMVLSSRMEHYANDLPWRHRGNTIYAEVDEKGRL